MANTNTPNDRDGDLPENILEIRDASVTFDLSRGVSRVLDDVDLDIRRDEVLGVVGESGSGKSMLANALVDAHLAAVQDRSYTLTVRVRVDGDRSERLFWVERPTRYYQVDRLADPRGDTAQFADGDTLYTRTEYGGGVDFGSYADPSPPRSQTVMLSRAFLQVDTVRVAETRVDGVPAYELTGQYPVHPAVSSLANFSLRAVVEPDGFIRSMNVSYVRTGAVDGTNVTRSFVYSDVDATTVERPTWVDREFNDTG